MEAFQAVREGVKATALHIRVAGKVAVFSFLTQDGTQRAIQLNPHDHSGRQETGSESAGTCPESPSWWTAGPGHGLELNLRPAFFVLFTFCE